MGGRMIITTIGMIGLLYCTFIFPFTESGQQIIKDKNDYSYMYMYTGFLLMTIFGYILQI